MTGAGEIQNELKRKGYSVDGVVAWNRRQEFYAVGYFADDLPSEVVGFRSVDDPNKL